MLCVMIFSWMNFNLFSIQGVITFYCNLKIFFSYFHFYFTFLVSYFLFFEILYFPKMPLYFQNDITLENDNDSFFLNWNPIKRENYAKFDQNNLGRFPNTYSFSHSLHLIWRETRVFTEWTILTAKLYGS